MSVLERFVTKDRMAHDDIHLMPDGIKEALCELRFEAGEISEIVIGRLADAPAWRGFSKTRLPGADLPPQIRALDPNAKFQPSFELRSVENPSIVVRIGGNVVSCHVIGKYPGWDHFYPLLKSTVDALKLAVSDTPVSRIGFRYINALTSKDHYVANAKALNLELKVGDKDVTDAFALNYRTRVTEEHICQLTVATPDYVTAPDPFDAYIDIDIFTVPNYSVVETAEIMTWIDVAHNELKQQFFKLLPSEVIERLRR